MNLIIINPDDLTNQESLDGIILPFFNVSSTLIIQLSRYTQYKFYRQFLSILATILYLSESGMQNSLHKPYQFGRKINLHDQLPSTARQISSPLINWIPSQPIKIQPSFRKPKSEPHQTIQHQQKAPEEGLVKTERQIDSYMHYTPEKLLGLKKPGGEERVKFIEKVLLSPKQQVELLKLSLRYIREENEEYLRHRASTIKRKIKNKFKGCSDPPAQVMPKKSKSNKSPRTKREEIGKYNQKFEEYLVRKNIHHNRYHTVVSEELHPMTGHATAREQQGKSAFRKVFRTLPDAPNKKGENGSPSSFLQKALKKLHHEDIPAIARMLLNSQQIPQNQITKRSSLLMTPKIQKSNHLHKKSPCGLREHFDSLEARYLNNCAISQDLQIDTHRDKPLMPLHHIKGSMNHNLIRKNVRYFKKDILPHLVREISKQRITCLSSTDEITMER